MLKLNDTQSILLSSASQRDGGSLYPLPKTLIDRPRILTAIASLLKGGFAEECEVTDVTLAYRQDGDLNIGVIVTAVGLAAIGVESGDSDPRCADAPAPNPRMSKRDNVIALLSREDGATLAELIATTGWLPHTTRAALTGLRKKGHAIERGKRGDETCYTVKVAA